MDIQTSIQLYLRDCSARGLRLVTQQCYSQRLQHFVTVMELTDTDEITYDLIRTFMAYLNESHYHDNTTDAYRRIILPWIKFLNDEGQTDLPAVAEKIKRPRLDKPGFNIADADELRMFLDAAETVPHKSQLAKLRDIAMLYVICDTGMRRAEIANMKMDNLDLVKRTIRIESTSKSRRERIVVFTPDTLRRIRGYLQKRKSDSAYVWITDYGQPASTAALRAAIKHAAEAAGMPALNPRAIRHSFATKAIKAGMPVTSVQRLMGHSNVSTTMVYVHLLNDDAIRDYDKYFM